MVNPESGSRRGTKIITWRQVLSIARNTAIIIAVFVSLFLIGASIELSPHTPDSVQESDVKVESGKSANTSFHENSMTYQKVAEPMQMEKNSDGTFTFSSNSVAESISERLPKEITAVSILLNNFKIVLLSSYLYPIGVIDTWMVAFVTGVGFSAFSSLANMKGMDVALQVLQRPFFWFEIIAYCLAAAQSIHLTKAVRCSLSIRQMMAANIKQMSMLFKRSAWREVRNGDNSVPRKVRLLRLLLNIDLLTIDKEEAKRQLLLSGIVIAIATMLLTFGAITEIQDIEAMMTNPMLKP
jgi:hypothetical protein